MDDRPDPTREDSPADKRFAEALDEYYRRLAADGKVDREALLEEFADVREALAEYLDTIEDVGRLAPTLGYLPSAVAPPLTTVRYIGDYELLQEIARGGMGVVYRARQVTLNRLVAVKMILAGRLASEEDVARFRQEATAAARLQHPNIVTIFEIGEHQGQHFFSMEYVEGTTLARLVRDNPISSQRAAEYVRTIAEAMSVTHAAGVLHRDLKPSNVLIESRTGLLRISDFGLAKSTDTATMFTTTGQVLGTPSYMAPEQAAGQNERVGPGSDIYAIGAILYELVTGRPPYVGETPWDTAWQVQHTETVAPSSLNPKVPRDLETICLKCLQKEIGRRYLSAQELADDLGRFLRGEPILARPVTRAERLRRWCLRNPALASALGAAALGFASLIAVLLVFGATQRNSARTLASALDVSETRRRESNFRLAETERDKGLRLCEQGDVDQGCLWLARSLGTAPDDAADLRWSIRVNLAAWQRELCTLEAIFPGEGRALAFSADGRRLATSDGQQRVLVREAPAWRPVGNALLQQGFPNQMRFGASADTLLLRVQQTLHLWEQRGDSWQQQPLQASIRSSGYQFLGDNQLLVALGKGKSVEIRDARTGELMGDPLPSDASDHGVVVISPDGAKALTQPESGRAMLSEVATGKGLGPPLVHAERVWGAAFSPDGRQLVTGSATRLDPQQMVPQAQIWDASTGEKVGDPLVHAAGEHHLDVIRYSADGERLFTGARGGTIRMWDRAGRALADPIPHHSPQYGRFDVSPDGRLLALFAPTREVRLRDTDAERTIGQALGVNDQLALSPDAQRIAVGNQREARVFTLPARGLIRPPLVHDREDPQGIWMAFSNSGNRLVTVGVQTSTARVWDARTGAPLGKPMFVRGGIQACAISPDGRYVATGAMQIDHRDRQGIRLWDANTGEQVERRLPQYEHAVRGLAFTGDGRRLISVGDAGQFFIYNLAKDERAPIAWKQPLHEDSEPIMIKLSPDGRVVAGATTWTHHVMMHDATTGKAIGAESDPEEGVDALAFSPDSQTLVTVGTKGIFWDTTTGLRKPTTLDYSARAWAVAYSSDGQRLATAHDDRTVRLWDATTGEPLGLPMEHAQTPKHVTFAGGDKLVLTSTADGCYLWDVATATPVGPPLAPARWGIASPDGQTLAVASSREVRLWKTPGPASDDAAALERAIETATGLMLDENRVARRLTAAEWSQRFHGSQPQR